MRLLDTRTTAFIAVDDPRNISYVILSHVWTRGSDGPREQTYEELTKIHQRRHPRTPRFLRMKQSLGGIPPSVSEKISRCCAVALGHGHERVWIDSCCIDRSSSSELSEAINSMFNWYSYAKVCYAYLADVEDEDDPRAPGSQFRRSRWFLRGWTLQELIAPRVLIFLSKGWRALGTKVTLAAVIEEVTCIDREILTHEVSLDEIGVAKRISWASRRQTTREEDEAYSLMGILGVNLPTIYGEGRMAFIRLQEEVLKQSPDQTLLAWGPAWEADTELQLDQRSDAHYSWEEDVETPYMLNLFALSPRDFSSCGRITRIPRHAFLEQLGLTCPLPEYTLTGHGVRSMLPVLAVTPSGVVSSEDLHLALLACQDKKGRMLALILRSQGRTHNEFYAGALLPLTMTMGEEELAGGDINRTILLGDRYYRTIYLSPQFISAHRQDIRLQDVYVPHRPSRARAQAFNGYIWIYNALTHTDRPFAVHLAAWCKHLLEKDGYAVTSLSDETDWDVGISLKRGFALSKDEVVVRVEVDACSCGRSLTNQWLRVMVSAGFQGECTDPSSSVDPSRRTFVMKHPREHDDHVCSWSFAAGVASQRFPRQLPDGRWSYIHLTLSLLTPEDTSRFRRSYELGIEILPIPPVGDTSGEAKAKSVSISNNRYDSENPTSI